MKEIDKILFKEIIQSGHINLLIGSGCSASFLSTLKNIEEKMNSNDTKEKIIGMKDYYKIIVKSKDIFSNVNTEELKYTQSAYDDFLYFWTEVLSKRSLHIVNKQINIFTTNFDMFVEDSCERQHIVYNDGFSGQINPIFGVSNFNKVLKFKSLQFDNTSDVPMFNIIKLHGSISWKVDKQNNKIVYSSGEHIDNMCDSRSDAVFKECYKRIAVINPNAEKHFETVLDTNYAAMLRKFTLELEKENSLLFIFGFSLEDKHIKELLYGVMRSNPTLIVIYFSYSSYDEMTDNLYEKSNHNLFIITNGGEFSFNKQTQYLKILFDNIFNNQTDKISKSSNDEQQ
jgi:hypothetical protein